MENGMVLVLSLWDDHEAGMLWLDSNFPADAVSISFTYQSIQIMYKLNASAIQLPSVRNF